MGIYFTSSIVYYGVNLNATNFKTNIYFSVLLNSFVEMPGYLLVAFLIDRYGRKSLGIGAQWFKNWKAIRMVCGVLGIFGMAGTYNLLYVYAMELFPTVVRSVAIGCARQAGQIGSILVPFVVVKSASISLMVFGICGIVGGILMFFLPETLNRPLYDTMDGTES
ncbi:putative major facilitator, sugar transporter, MFS transporter superfamily [Helianthus annuus]|nr:putative major facilitator, sugar transporter, MFS transporter superfamily [Helianthus annuus]